MTYAKICIICQKKFWAIRINKLFCSKQCSNRTRYLPKDLVRQLAERNSKYAIKATNYVAMVTDKNGEESAIGVELTPQTITDLETVARNMKRDIDEKEKQKSLESSSGFAEIIDATVHITTENDLTLSSIKQMVEIIKDNPTIVHPKKYKIKSLQRNGDK